MAPVAPLSSTSLQYFIRVVELGSFTAAAQSLGVSQPSLSVAVSKLEKDLGTRLLVRGARGVAATKTGEALLRHAKQVLRAMDHAREEIDSLETEPRGSFTLGCHESLAAYLLPKFMSRFLERYPLIQISLWNGNSRDVEREVILGNIDLGLVVNPQDHPDCVVQPLFTDRVEFVALASLVKSASADELLAERPLLHVPALRQTAFLVDALVQRGLRPRQELKCSSLELVKSLVLDGVGIGILPHRVANHNVPDRKLVSLPFPTYDDSIALVRRFDMHVTHASRELVDALLEHGRQMPPLPKLAQKNEKKKRR
jgi:DNA-binding transcriptional LysR family regulator